MPAIPEEFKALVNRARKMEKEFAELKSEMADFHKKLSEAPPAPEPDSTPKERSAWDKFWNGEESK